MPAPSITPPIWHGRAPSAAVVASYGLSSAAIVAVSGSRRDLRRSSSASPAPCSPASAPLTAEVGRRHRPAPHVAVRKRARRRRCSSMPALVDRPRRCAQSCTVGRGRSRLVQACRRPRSTAVSGSAVIFGARRRRRRRRVVRRQPRSPPKSVGVTVPLPTWLSANVPVEAAAVRSPRRQSRPPISAVVDRPPHLMSWSYHFVPSAAIVAVSGSRRDGRARRRRRRRRVVRRQARSPPKSVGVTVPLPTWLSANVPVEAAAD